MGPGESAECVEYFGRDCCFCCEPGEHGREANSTWSGSGAEDRCLIWAGRRQTATPAESALTPSLGGPLVRGLPHCRCRAGPGKHPACVSPMRHRAGDKKIPRTKLQQLSGRPSGRERVRDDVGVLTLESELRYATRAAPESTPFQPCPLNAPGIGSVDIQDLANAMLKNLSQNALVNQTGRHAKIYPKPQLTNPHLASPLVLCPLGAVTGPHPPPSPPPLRPAASRALPDTAASSCPPSTPCSAGRHLG